MSHCIWKLTQMTLPKSNQTGDFEIVVYCEIYKPWDLVRVDRFNIMTADALGLTSQVAMLLTKLYLSSMWKDYNNMYHGTVTNDVEYKRNVLFPRSISACKCFSAELHLDYVFWGDFREQVRQVLDSWPKISSLIKWMNPEISDFHYGD